MRNKERFIKKWEETRKKGKRRYILGEGLLIVLVMMIGGIIGKIIAPQSVTLEKYWFIYYGFLIGGLTGGLHGANIRWNRNDEKYKDLTNHKQ